MSGFLGFAHATLAFGKHRERVNASLVFQTDEFLIQEVEHITERFTLQRTQRLIDALLL